LALYTPDYTERLAVTASKSALAPQHVYMEADRTGWKAKELYYTYGQKVRWEIEVTELTLCNKTIQIPALDIVQPLKEGINIIEPELCNRIVKRRA